MKKSLIAVALALALGFSFNISAVSAQTTMPANATIQQLITILIQLQTRLLQLQIFSVA
ncbi:MAG: hypothetical protein HYT48_00925 [Candidatus Vogelbacteria bacterium]|nr:hypothetical protein [Candidatus Vogelbacteria bacterium]